MPGTIKIVIAPNAFKGTLTAAEAAHAMAAGVGDATGGCADVVQRPVADGGDGTVAAAVAAGFTRHRATVSGPTGSPVQAAFAVRGDTAVLEMAEASGLRLLARRGSAPLTASTAGTGELIRAALDVGARRLLLGAGGSATTDGGAGMATALGARLLDHRGRPLPPGGAALRDLASVDLTGLDTRLADVDVTVAADVDSPLLGPHGAAAVFGPQKGAGPADVAVLEEGLHTLAERLAALPRAGRVIPAAKTVPVREAMLTAGAGAAGGLGFGAMVLLGARVRPGADLLLDLVDFGTALTDTSLVITGEGALDAQTLRGKAPLVVAGRARTAGIPVLAVCGRIDIGEAEWRTAGFTAAVALHPTTGRGGVAHRLRRRTTQAVHALLPGLGPARGR